MTKISPTGTCQFWVASRQRYCKFALAKDSNEFCPIHNTGSGDGERIPCPADPSHMVLKRDVEKHLLRCNKVLEDRFAAHQPFTLTDCNIVRCNQQSISSTVEKMIPQEEIEDWRSKLQNAKTQLVSRINAFGKGKVGTPECEQRAPVWSQTVTDCAVHITDFDYESREKIDKHNLQNACLLQVISENGLSPMREDKTVFIELGCGKAGLTRWLIHSLPDEADSVSVEKQPIFMLLDYEARRNKNENKKEVRSKLSPLNIIRLRSNIKDVDLTQFLIKSSNPPPEKKGKTGSVEERLFELQSKVHAIQSRDSWPYSKVVGTAKHLCGAATDFGLRCLARINDRQISLVFATCCHHRCDWAQLVNQSVFTELKICSSAQEFKRMISMAGWATTAGLGEDKRTVGRLVKAVIDMSRVLWILETFPNVARVSYDKYIDDGITPENFCIVMQSNSSS